MAMNRPRRNRVSAPIRGLVRETHLGPEHLVLPLFVHEGPGAHAIASMPGHARLDLELLAQKSREPFDLGVPAVAIFPALPEALKNPRANASLNAPGLPHRAVCAPTQA